jgi:hypothetical protein
LGVRRDRARAADAKHVFVFGRAQEREFSVALGTLGIDPVPDSAPRVLDRRSYFFVPEKARLGGTSMPMQQLVSTVDWRLLLPVIVVQLLLLAVALIDCIRAERTRGAKWIWILVIVLLQLIGPVLYFVFGKEKSS